ncbi:glycosyl transferase family 90-domain-containing protein [Mycena belliarum]|uniref:Glycosyl transferase family 90-domain-containing protein n=1 Tax=Mycena belliarum TaxID=1033014 RepID=A0AAD6XJD1_9AGAR|nr:glycosyl transferase family 90-domain-containing protein [Mycena belliae]
MGAVLSLSATTVILTLVFQLLLHRVRSLDSADPAVAARLAVDALFARQSASLTQARARYSLHNQRAPPPGYDGWYEYVQEHKCLVDEYDQIQRDFKPFYQLAEADPEYFRRMIKRGDRVLGESPAEITFLEIRNGEPFLRGDTAYGGYWPVTLNKFSAHLPNMTFFMNGRDEPRVAFNYRAPGALQHALSLPKDSTPFQISPHPTSDFFGTQSGCNAIPMEATGFVSSINEETGFLLASAKPGFTTDLYPMLSMSRISPCFSDILVPSEYFYDRSWWSGKFGHPDDIPWDDKEAKAYWRGMSNGGMIIGDNYRHFARFKLADLGRAHPDLIDAAITRFAETLCDESCNRTAVMAEYNITGNSEAREELYRFKYAIDVDGTTFSGRYLGLLRSGSLVFKATVFEEYFNDWLRPFEHYIPVNADLSNLPQRIRWANANPEEARRIQQRGLEVARRVLTDEQNDCYFLLVLLEWARLQESAHGLSA